MKKIVVKYTKPKVRMKKIGLRIKNGIKLNPDQYKKMRNIA